SQKVAFKKTESRALSNVITAASASFSIDIEPEILPDCPKERVLKKIRLHIKKHLTPILITINKFILRINITPVNCSVLSAIIHELSETSDPALNTKMKGGRGMHL